MNPPDPTDLLPCRLCSEDATLVEFAGICIASVRRKTKCKRFRPKLGTMESNTCRTGECQSPEQAAAEWNAMQQPTTAKP